MRELETFYFGFNFFFFAPPYRILDPGQGIEFVPPALEVQSLNCWTGREVPENHHS